MVMGDSDYANKRKKKRARHCHDGLRRQKGRLKRWEREKEESKKESGSAGWGSSSRETGAARGAAGGRARRATRRGAGVHYKDFAPLFETE